MLGILLVLVCSLIWYLPFCRRQGRTDRVRVWKCLLAVLTGAVPVFLVSVGLQILLGRLPFVASLSRTGHFLFSAFVEAALVEELVKFAAALLLVRLFKPKRKIGYALIFGGVGLGFHLVESGVMSGNLISAVVGALLAFHLFWQFWMGLRFFEADEAKRSGRSPAPSLVPAFLLPIVTHGINDFLAFMASGTSDIGSAEMSAGWALGYFVWLLLFIVFIVLVIRQVGAAAKESRRSEQLTD